MSTKEKHISYQQAREQSFVAATTIRIFGVPLEGNLNDDTIAIWWCGFGFSGVEHRECTTRIWHLSKSDVVNSGEVEGFFFNEYQVCWYDVDRDSDPIEETFSVVSLSHALRLYFGAFLGDGPLEAQAGPPLTISPSPTTSPTGTPPITISPSPTVSPTGTPPITIRP